MAKILVSGASSGLGRYLHANLAGDKFYRDNAEKNPSVDVCYDMVIHCAFGQPNKNQTYNEYIEYQKDICQKIIKYKCKKLVFISSIECHLNESIQSEYAKAKRIIEKLIIKNCKDFLILRVGLLFGSKMRPNQMLRIAIEDSPNLTLDNQSTFSYVEYKDVLESILSNQIGTKTIVANRLMSLKEVGLYFSSKPKWGGYKYYSPPISMNYKNIYQYTDINIDPLLRLSSFVKNKGWK